MLLPIEGQKVEGIGPGPLEEGIRDREQEPTRTSNRAAIATSLRHDFITKCRQKSTLNRKIAGKTIHYTDSYFVVSALGVTIVSFILSEIYFTAQLIYTMKPYSLVLV